MKNIFNIYKEDVSKLNENKNLGWQFVDEKTAMDGVLLLLPLLTTEIHGHFKPYEVYFGRGLTFLTLAIIQSLICSIGDLMVLGVTVVDPLLPFTYAISALRETIGGVYMNNLSRDIIVLFIFLVTSICINVLLKGPINRLSQKFRAKFNESNLAGH